MKKKIILFTNNERSINVIKSLSKEHQIILIVVSKKFLTKNLEKKILNFNIKTIYFENYIKKLKEKLLFQSPDFIICCGFPKKISREIINIPKYCSINLHGGKMPNYLGGSTLNWQIINGERKLYLCSIKMNHKIDGGPLIIQKYIKINDNSNIDEIKYRINKIFPKLCLDSINHILNKKKIKLFLKKDKKYWKQRTKKDSEIKLSKFDVNNAHNLIRGSSNENYPAFINLKDKKIILYKSKVLKTYLKSKKQYFIKNKVMYINFYDKTLQVKKFKIIKK